MCVIKPAIQYNIGHKTQICEIIYIVIRYDIKILLFTNKIIGASCDMFSKAQIILILTITEGGGVSMPQVSVLDTSFFNYMENDTEMWRTNVESDFERCVFCYMRTVIHLGVHKRVSNLCSHPIEWHPTMSRTAKTRHIVINLMQIGMEDQHSALCMIYIY